MMNKIKIAVIVIATMFMTNASPVHAQGFLSGLFGGGGSSSDKGNGCGGTPTHFIECSSKEGGVEAIGDVIRIVIIVMTFLIGIIATGGLAYAGILYASARDNKEKVAEALGVVRNVVIGLLLYVFTIAIINWLIPGSVISGGPEPSPSPTVSPTQ